MHCFEVWKLVNMLIWLTLYYCSTTVTFIQHSSFLLIVRSDRYARSINIFIDGKCLVFAKCLPEEKSLPSTESLPFIKSLPCAKSLPTTKSLAFTTFLVIDKHLIDENLSNMADMLTSNKFSYWKYSSGNISKTK